jgi:hypothetical protein
MKTKKTIETTTEELSYMEVPGGPVDPKKGALVVWRVERTTQRQAMRGTRKYKPGAPKTHVQTGMGWEKQVARGGRGWVAEVQHPSECGDKAFSKGSLALVREDRWDEFLAGALKYDMWGGCGVEKMPEGWSKGIIIGPETAWDVVTSGTPVKVLNQYGYAHLLFDGEGLPLPQRVGFNYLDGHMNNECYDLKAVVEVLQKRDDVTIYPNGGERPLRNGSPIGRIPYYNSHEGHTHCIKFDWHPSVEDYRKAWLASLKLKKPPEANGVPWPNPPTFGWRSTIVETVFGVHRKDDA